MQHETPRIVRYWHPRLGGWHNAYFVRIDEVESKAGKNQWAVIRDVRTQHSHRVPATDIREVAA
jgi:hypothetical protein